MNWLKIFAVIYNKYNRLQEITASATANYIARNYNEWKKKDQLSCNADEKDFIKLISYHIKDNTGFENFINITDFQNNYKAQSLFKAANLYEKVLLLSAIRCAEPINLLVICKKYLNLLQDVISSQFLDNAISILSELLSS